MPLLSGEVRVDSFVLVDPVIKLEIDHKGRANWEFESAAGPAAGDGSPGGGDAPGLAEISLGDVRLVNGKVSYRDARTGEVIELSAINMSIELPSLDLPVAAEGSIIWNREKVNLVLDVENPRALLKGGLSAVAVEVGADPVSIEFRGKATATDPLSVAGTVQLSVPSIRELTAWTGNPLSASGDGLGPLEISGDLAVNGPQVSFSQAEIALDGMAARGNFRVDTSGRVPKLEGRLDWDALDLNLYMSSEGDGSGAGAQAAKPAVTGGPSDWSDDPIDFTGLKAANADFDLTVKSIVFDRVQIGKSVVKVGLNNGRLGVDLKELALYGGNGTAKLVLNTRGKVLLVSETLSFKGIQLEPMLTDAAGFDKMSGTASLELTAKTHGRTERQMVAGLNGAGAISSADGAIRGLNLGSMVRNAARAFLGEAGRQQAKTDYAEMKASFTIVNGVLSNRDLNLVGPYVSVTGSGTADMNRRRLKYRVVPTAMAASTRTVDGPGVTVPVLIDGPWHDPRFRPDLKALITETAKDPAKVLSGAKKTLKALKKEGLGGLLQGLGQPPAAPSADSGDGTIEPAPAPQNGDPRQLLKGLFGG
jgi:AsmA protein